MEDNTERYLKDISISLRAILILLAFLAPIAVGILSAVTAKH